jgi:hypothetical protein
MRRLLTPSGSSNALCLGNLCDAEPAQIREAAARTKIRRYREACATPSGVTYAFLPLILEEERYLKGLGVVTFPPFK